VTSLASGVVVKLGGSVVTDKASTALRVREVTVRRLAREIAASGIHPLVVVHGAGSFGHQIVERTGIHRGLRGPLDLLAFGETQRLQYDLDSAIARIFLEEGLPVLPCQASASAVLRDGRLERLDVEALRIMVERGMIPLLYGVPAVDVVRGCAILSGDRIAPWVAAGLGLGWIVHGTDVDGVFDADPKVDPSARRIPRIDRATWDEVRARLGGSRAVDVTGGMVGKVSSLLSMARGGPRSRIVDANLPGRVAAALAGEEVGTLVEWEPAP
jgi:isopentenyl phosphate kinase